jgi:alpha-beta hydrolase superfamily lysophospholipase
MGQGGSGGFMHETRLSGPEDVEIRTLAKKVWDRFARSDRPSRLVLGWSTGGLVAFQLAHDGWANSVVLIAPGISPMSFAGDFFAITESNLACREFEVGKNPHLDPIKPGNVLEVKGFKLNLGRVAWQSEFWEISRKIPGLVFTAGKDKFVESSEIPVHLRMSAPHFETVLYSDACHEIHSGPDAVRYDLQKRTIDFFNAFTNSLD